MNTLVLAAALAVTNNLGTVVVEASRLGETANRMPVAVQVFTADEIAKSGSQDVVDFLAKNAPALHVSSLAGANPAMRQISMGGYGENGFGRTLVLVDGERLNNPDMSIPNLSQIDLGSVRRIEVLKGPQTVLHGDAASAGMINIVTEPEGYDPHGHVEVHGGSWDTIGVSLGYSGGLEEFGTQYWVNGGWDRSNGYRANSDYEIWNANAGVKQNFDNGSYLRVSAFYNNADYHLPRALGRDDWKANRRHSVQEDAKYVDEKADHYERLAFGLNATGYGVINDENALKLTFTASRRETKSGTYGSGSYADYDWTTYAYLGTMDYVWTSLLDYDMYSYRLTPQWINTTTLGVFENAFILGVEFGYDRLRVKSSAPMFYHPTYGAPSYVTPSSSDSLIDRMDMSSFAQDTFHFTDFLALQLGVRYERMWNRDTAAATPESRDNLWAYEGALLFTPVDDLKTFVRFARFYRAPFLDENPYNGGSEALRILDPEKGWTVSGGGEYRFLGDFAVSADAFLSRTEDEIFYNPFFSYNAAWGSWTKDNVNSPSPVRRYGVNAAFSWEREKVAGVTVAYSYVHASFVDGQYEHNRVPLVPESTVSANGRVWLWDDCFVFGGYRYQTEMFTISDFENDGCGHGSSAVVPSFGVFHVGVTYEPTFHPWLKGFKFSFVCDNLFDRRYCDYATYGTNYYPGAGRCYMLTVRYEF